MTTQIPLPEMTTATRNTLAHVQKLVPPMLDHFHKGSSATEGDFGVQGY